VHLLSGRLSKNLQINNQGRLNSMNTRLGSGASVVGKGKTSKRRPRKSPKQEAQDLLDAMAPFHTRKKHEDAIAH